MYVFGDSYSDSGAGYVDGNGPTAVWYLAKELGIRLTPASDSPAETKSLNFAVSGAQTGEGDGQRVCPGKPVCGKSDALFGRGIKTQVHDFVAMVKRGKVKFDPDKTIFIIAGGLNDRSLSTDTTVSNLSSEMQELYEAGARNFWLALLPETIKPFHDVAVRLNPAISRLPDSLHSSMPVANVALSMWGPFFDIVMDHAAHYGFTNVTEKCAGRIVLGDVESACADPRAHYFYHDFHPSTAVHRIVGGLLVTDLEYSFPQN